MINVKDFGAVGNGTVDDSNAIQKALLCGGEIHIPKGDYRVSKTLKIGSDTRIVADSKARIFHCEKNPKKRGDFLITNADFENGNENISITGGVWDGNFDGKNNNKPSDLFDKNGWSGTVINFFNVKNLKLSHMEIANSVVYHTRFCKIDGFEFDDISFSAKCLAFNQDGLHFGGECKNGVVTNIRAVTKGETNDDLIALNADDSTERVENLDLICGDIENITFKNLYAEDCHTGIRMLSVHSNIRNIKFENVYVGCREFAINMDGARYCATPLFKEEDMPLGCGNIENIEILNMEAYVTEPNKDIPLITCESRLNSFEIKNFKRLYEKEEENNRKTFEMKNVVDNKFVCNGKTYYAGEKTDKIKIDDMN